MRSSVLFEKIFTGLHMDKDHAIKIGETLTQSAIFKKYEDAFFELTNLPLHYIPFGSDEFIDGMSHHDNKLCQHFLVDTKVCNTCAMMHERLRELSADEVHTATCFAGLTESVVPVKLGEEVIGYLQTGQVLLKEPDQNEIDHLEEYMSKLGVDLKPTEIRELFLESHVMSPSHYDAALSLLDIFASHLSTIVNQMGLDMTDEEREPERVAAARNFINKHLDEPLTLPKVADAVHTSSFYFSRMFKQVTGHTFTEYLAKARIERAKQLMRDHNKNITQIAYESGFQSLSQFNRVFRKVQREAPGTFRKKMDGLLGSAH